MKKAGNPDFLSAELQAELGRLEAMPDDTIDFSDIPPTTDFSNGRRGVFYRPKTSVTIRLDPDVVEFFKAGGEGYQTRINDALREYAETHKLT